MSKIQETDYELGPRDYTMYYGGTIIGVKNLKSKQIEVGRYEECHRQGDSKKHVIHVLTGPNKGKHQGYNTEELILGVIKPGYVNLDLTTFYLTGRHTRTQNYKKGIILEDYTFSINSYKTLINMGLNEGFSNVELLKKAYNRKKYHLYPSRTQVVSDFMQIFDGRILSKALSPNHCLALNIRMNEIVFMSYNKQIAVIRLDETAIRKSLKGTSIRNNFNFKRYRSLLKSRYHIKLEENNTPSQERLAEETNND